MLFWIGQKCSALSRLYVPISLWTAKGGFKDQLVDECGKLKMGNVIDFENFVNPVMYEARLLSRPS